jgi:NAD(P)H-flavin reductase/ferredoxin
MGKTHRVIVNGEEFAAQRGDILLDAALMNGVQIPHDCRSGHCGTCRVNIVAGSVFGGDSPKEAKACQCRIVSDIKVEVEDVPDIVTGSGRLVMVKPVAPDVVELCVALRQPIDYLPGQYFQVKFRGYSARCYSPTVPLDRHGDRRFIHFHIRRVPNGQVSLALGSRITTGHRVRLEGPFGAAYLRFGRANRLVLVASGTGFAPIWSIAEAAVRENPRREIVVLVGARSMESLYMIPALWRLASFPNVTIIPTTNISQSVTPVIRAGSPIDYLPPLSRHDLVYAAGSPRLVDAIREAADACGATLYSDSFVSSAGAPKGLLSQAKLWLWGQAPVSSPPTAPTATQHDTARGAAAEVRQHDIPRAAAATMQARAP